MTFFHTMSSQKTSNKKGSVKLENSALFPSYLKLRQTYKTKKFSSVPLA